MRAKTPKIKIEFGKPPPKIQRVREVTDKDVEEDALKLHAQGLTPYYASQVAVGKAKRLLTPKG